MGRTSETSSSSRTRDDRSYYQARRTKLGATALVVNTHVIVDQLIRLKVGGVKHFKLGGFLGMHLILFETTFAGSEKPVCKKVQTWSDRS